MGYVEYLEELEQRPQDYISMSYPKVKITKYEEVSYYLERAHIEGVIPEISGIIGKEFIGSRLADLKQACGSLLGSTEVYKNAVPDTQLGTYQLLKDSRMTETDKLLAESFLSMGVKVESVLKKSKQEEVSHEN